MAGDFFIYCMHLFWFGFFFFFFYVGKWLIINVVIVSDSLRPHGL